MSDTTVVTNVGVGGNELVNFTPVSEEGGGGVCALPYLHQSVIGLIVLYEA